jgi:two-component system response regulator YesN
MSLKILQDIRIDTRLNYFLNNSLEGNVSDVLKVDEYLSNLKFVNPAVHSLSIYYKKNNLLVSTNYIRHTLYKNINEQKDLSYYNQLITNIEGSPNNLTLVFDNTENLDIKLNIIPETIVHFIRVIPWLDKSTSGAIIITISGKVFSDIIKQYVPEDLGSICIFDENGMIISHTNRQYIGTNIVQLDYGKTVLDSIDSSAYFINDVKGIPAVVSYCTSSYSNWRFVSIAPVQSITSAVIFILRTFSSVALLSILVGFIISIFTTRKLSLPLKTIANDCRKIQYINDTDICNKSIQNEYLVIASTLNNLTNIMEEQEKEISDLIPILRVNFLNSILSGVPLSIPEIKQKLKFLNLDFPYKNFCVVVVKVVKSSEHSTSIELKYNAIENVIEYEYEKIQISSYLEKIFTTPSSLCLLNAQDNIITALLNFDFEENKLYALGRKFVKYNLIKMPISLYLAFGSVDTDLKRMGTSYKIAISGLNYSYVFPEKKIYTFNETIIWEEKRAFASNLLLNNLINSMKIFDRQMIVSDLEKLVFALRDGNHSYQQIINILSSCIMAIEELLSATQMEKLEDFLPEGIDNLDEVFQKATNILEFKEWFIFMIDTMFQKTNDKSLSRTNELVIEAQDFINNNIQNCQLSLELTAYELGVSPNYLSRIFKDVTGVTFIDYITNLKLNYCRNLILNTNLKIGEISTLLGYSTPQYLISRFKIKFGCTPGIYRKKHSDM